MNRLKKVGIIGSGHVGSHCALTLISQGVVDDIKLVDIHKQKAISQALDCMDTLSFLPHRVKVSAGDYEDLGDRDIIIISIGTIDNVSKDRLGELKVSLEIVNSFIPKVMESGFKGYFVVISNPVDIITYYVQKLSGLPHNKVIGTGTGLDSARLKRILSTELDIDASSIQAFMLGEHGNSQFACFSNTYIQGKKLNDFIEENKKYYPDFNYNTVEIQTREAGWNIYVGKNSTEFGIAYTCCEIIKAIYHNERKILAVSGYLQGEYGYYDIYTGVPAIIGKNGIEKIIELSLDSIEQAKLKASVDIIRKHIILGKEYIK